MCSGGGSQHEARPERSSISSGRPPAPSCVLSATFLAVFLPNLSPILIQSHTTSRPQASTTIILLHNPSDSINTQSTIWHCSCATLDSTFKGSSCSQVFRINLPRMTYRTSDGQTAARYYFSLHCFACCCLFYYVLDGLDPKLLMYFPFFTVPGNCQDCRPAWIIGPLVSLPAVPLFLGHCSGPL